MKLVERFVEFNEWPASRKTVLLVSALFVFHLLIFPGVYLLALRAQIADTQLILKLFITPFFILLAIIAMSLKPAINGQDARWTAYLLILGYGTWIAALVLAFGFWSSPLEAFVPIAVIVLVLWYDLVVGVAGFLYTLVWAVILSAGVLVGLIPFAPVFIDRSLDAQSNPYWMAFILFLFMAIYIFGLAIVAMSVAARNRQDVRLGLAHRLIRRYVPPTVAGQIIAGQHAAVDAPRRQRVSVLFCDIIGFTDIADRVEPEVMTQIIGEYMAAMSEIVDAHQGTVNEFIGDGLMALFGAPEPLEPEVQARQVILAAQAMQAKLPELNQYWRKLGLGAPLQIRIGINTGMVSVGSYGSEGRMTYTAIGLQTNIAARIQSHCEAGGILISEATWRLVEDIIDCEFRGEVECKGVHYPVKVYAPMRAA